MAAAPEIRYFCQASTTRPQQNVTLTVKSKVAGVSRFMRDTPLFGIICHLEFISLSELLLFFPPHLYIAFSLTPGLCRIP